MEVQLLDRIMKPHRNTKKVVLKEIKNKSELTIQFLHLHSLTLNPTHPQTNFFVHHNIFFGVTTLTGVSIVDVGVQVSNLLFAWLDPFGYSLTSWPRRLTVYLENHSFNSIQLNYALIQAEDMIHSKILTHHDFSKPQFRPYINLSLLWEPQDKAILEQYAYSASLRAVFLYSLSITCNLLKRFNNFHISENYSSCTWHTTTIISHFDQYLIKPLSQNCFISFVTSFEKSKLSRQVLLIYWRITIIS